MTIMISLSGGEGVLSYMRLLGMCRWMGSHFHYRDWLEWGRIFNRITRMGWHMFGFFLGKILLHITVSNLPECLCCRWKVKCSSFSLKSGCIHDWLVTKMGYIIDHRKDYNGLGLWQVSDTYPAKNKLSSPPPPGFHCPVHAKVNKDTW